MKTKTDYTIERKRTMTVLRHGKIEALGFSDTESALHAIWVMEGRRPDRWYSEEDGVVYLHEGDQDERD